MASPFSGLCYGELLNSRYARAKPIFRVREEKPQ
jgi:hypothetical protein|tara:strand:+ start:342 stop:443 length:102 start_codon:yes stop_codon:yes gene_type:complete